MNITSPFSETVRAQSRHRRRVRLFKQAVDMALILAAFAVLWAVGGVI